MRDEPIKDAAGPKHGKNCNLSPWILVCSADKLVIKVLLFICLRQRREAWREMTVQMIDRRCITSNDNYENKSLTNTSKSVASISSGALTFI